MPVKPENDEEFDASKLSIHVKTQFLADQSPPETGQFSFAYTISICNSGNQAVQLLGRHWVITDGNDTVQEVKGDGVIGQQPVIEPGKIFTYTSGATLATEVGFMHGSYTMTTLSDNARFKIAISPFTLHTPNAIH